MYSVFCSYRKISDFSPRRKASLGSNCRQTMMYPKVKVRVQRDEADQYGYEKSSLQSLKAYDWLSLDHFSFSDVSTEPVVRVPGSYVPQSLPHTFHTSKEQTPQKKGVVKSPRSTRAASAPRPRAVLSSTDNDGIFVIKTPVRKELLLSLKDHTQCQNRHTRCKVISRSAAAETSSTTRSNKQSAIPRNDIHAKSTVALTE